MRMHTPGMEAQHAALAALSSRYVNVEAIPWQDTAFPGIRIKVLMQDPDTGLQTILTHMAPGAVLTDHTHTQVEQSWVLEGSLVDHEGEVTAGNFVWRPAGSRHTAHAPNGALVLGFFLQPNHFY
ncbi:MAG: hypothetical protein FGM28_08005 [Limnohabitans sp.]|jgi:anti-sigma factor ChrR (cupin superfamily)|nr:hypothetical protein [Limnohabitans sp.]